jgi:hypothetical protein
LAGGETPVFENLQQYVEDTRLRVLDFIERNEVVRTAADLFGRVGLNAGWQPIRAQAERTST